VMREVRGGCMPKRATPAASVQILTAASCAITPLGATSPPALPTGAATLRSKPRRARPVRTGRARSVRRAPVGEGAEVVGGAADGEVGTTIGQRSAGRGARPG
jgi:hypothetical protein